jgi:hypothetical protein
MKKTALLAALVLSLSAATSMAAPDVLESRVWINAIEACALPGVTFTNTFNARDVLMAALQSDAYAGIGSSSSGSYYARTYDGAAQRIRVDPQLSPAQRTAALHVLYNSAVDAIDLFEAEKAERDEAANSGTNRQ